MKALFTHRRRLAAMAMAVLLLLICPMSASAEVFSAIITANTMPVYGEMALTTKLGSLEKDTVVRVVGFSNSVAKISYRGYTGFAKISDMKTVDEVAKKAVTANAATVYEFEDHQGRSARVRADLRVYVLSVDGDTAKVEKNGVVGYMDVADLIQTEDDWSVPSASPAPEATPAPTDEESEGVPGVVSDDTLAVYATASTAGRRLGTLERGQVVNVIRWNSGWAYIELSGHYGYCAVSGLARGTELATPVPTAFIPETSAPSLDTASEGTVVAESMAVYQTASTGGRLLGTLKKGRVVNVVQTNGGWAYIELNGHYGFCQTSDLSIAGSGATAAPTSAPSLDSAVPAVVTDSAVPVYQTASTAGRKLGTMQKGWQVNVVSWSGEWAYIELNGHYGFCKLSALTRADQLYRLPSGYHAGGFTATVISSKAKAYASASTEASGTSLSLGAEVSVYGYTSEWACVIRNDKLAYVPVKYLSREIYETVDADGSAVTTLLKALLRYGYFDGVPSKKLNADAVTAIKRFQSACGFGQTGTANQTLQRILYGGSAPKHALLSQSLSGGDSGEYVTRIQNRLYALGYLSKTSSLDGDYGKNTTAAVKQFQSTNGLSSSGKADSETIKAMYSTKAKSLPSGVKPADVTTTTTTTYTGSSYLDSVPAGLESTVSTYSSDMSNAEKLEYVIYLAQNQLGKPYVYGSTGPNSYDCSGLTTYIFRKIGINLNRSAYAQGYDNKYPKIEGSGNLVRGDLVFFDTISDSDLSDHAGIYIGNGFFIHASSGGHRVVVSNLTGGYYVRAFSWGRRVLE